MYPGINLFGHSVNSLLFFWVTGIILSMAYYVIYGKIIKYKWYKSLLLGIFFLFSEILGAKILYIFENLSYVAETGISFFGFSFFGIMFSVPLLVWLLSKVIKIPCKELLDFASVGILIELSLYRIGCMCQGCCHGFISDLGIVGYDGLRYFPVQPIEAVLDIFLALSLVWLKHKNVLYTGEQYLLYMAGYGLIRFILEFLRVRTYIIGTLSISHIWALTAVLFAVGILLFGRKRQICNDG
ncbi:MAG: prolipoprotein diacylglyceryl transferase [Oscillospiraceae bacterium]|nr:prolipoprotein diacylglyceryl transferase [Oscillospiraceae bacterium]